MRFHLPACLLALAAPVALLSADLPLPPVSPAAAVPPLPKTTPTDGARPKVEGRAPAPATLRTISPPRPVPFPGGLLDPTGRVAYLAGEAETVDAVDLLTGDLLWQTREAQVPLLVAGDRLYAQAGVKRNRLRVLTFDLSRANRGECLAESDPVIFPRWVVPAEAPGRAFTAAWRVDGARLGLYWSAAGWADVEGLTTHREPATRKSAEGTAFIDLESGEVEAGPARPVPGEAGPVTSRAFEKLAVRWSRQTADRLLAIALADVPEAAPAPEVRGGFQVAAPAAAPRTPSARKTKLVLHAWNRTTGQPEKPRDLLTGSRLVILPTLDERHLLMRDAAGSPDELVKGTASGQDWILFDPATATTVTRVPFQPGTQAALLVGGRLYLLVAGAVTGAINRPHLRAQSVQAFDLDPRKKVWERAVAGRITQPPGR